MSPQSLKEIKEKKHRHKWLKEFVECPKCEGCEHWFCESCDAEKIDGKLQ